MNNNNVMAEPVTQTVEETEQTRKAKKATRAAVFGTFVEYYDFSVYGYAKKLGSDKAPSVLLPQEWLAGVLPQAQSVEDAAPYYFLPHCTEKTNEPSSIGLWQQVFERMGLKLSVQASGCCGMSGTYGHETKNAGTSVMIYKQSWALFVTKFNTSGRLLADGYSCRSQVKRQDGVTVLHPLQALLATVRQRTKLPSRQNQQS